MAYGWEPHPDTHLNTREIPIWDVSRTLPHAQDKLRQKPHSMHSWFVLCIFRGKNLLEQKVILTFSVFLLTSDKWWKQLRFDIGGIHRTAEEKVDKIWGRGRYMIYADHRYIHIQIYVYIMMIYDDIIIYSEHFSYAIVLRAGTCQPEESKLKSRKPWTLCLQFLCSCYHVAFPRLFSIILVSICQARWK